MKIEGEYSSILPDGYSWLFMKYENGLGLIGAHPDKEPIAYRCDGLNWTECKIILKPSVAVCETLE